MPVTRDAELEEFKTRIDLRGFATDMGYVWDRKESWRGSSVMRHSGTGDKIIIKRDTDQHYVYFSVRDDADNGSIIDFLQRRRPCSLGQVRQALRPWIGKTATVAALFPALPVTTKDRLEVETAFRRMAEITSHPYLESERGLPSTLLGSSRFTGRIRIDGFGNAIFPHFDQEGLCGYEIKNKGYTGFAKGGEKGLWPSHREETDNRLVVAESAIDALSHAALFPAPGTRYASIGGQMNPRQPLLLQTALKSLPGGSTVVAAMDADDQGLKLAEIVREAVTTASRPDLSFTLHQPPQGKDWNDQLRLTPPDARPALNP